jgi:IS5 family transposase
MLRVYFLQQRFNSSDPGAEDALYESPVPDESTILHFRHLLERHELGGAMLNAVNQYLESQGIRISTGRSWTRVDGTLFEAWAGVKSYQRKDAKSAVSPDDPRNATVDFHGEKRSNETHASKTDPDAKMARKGKGKEAKLSYNGNLLVENRNRLIVNTEVFEANGTAERDAALVMLEQIPGTKQVTVGGDKAYDTTDFVAECRNLKVTPHVAQNVERPGGSAFDARTTQHAGYAISQRKRETR